MKSDFVNIFCIEWLVLKLGSWNASNLLFSRIWISVDLDQLIRRGKPAKFYQNFKTNPEKQLKKREEIEVHDDNGSCCGVVFFFAEYSRVPDVCGAIEALGGDSHLSVPGGSRPSSGPIQRLQRRPRRDPSDVEVRRPARILQGPLALHGPRHAQHLPRLSHLRNVHQRAVTVDRVNRSIYFLKSCVCVCVYARAFVCSRWLDPPPRPFFLSPMLPSRLNFRLPPTPPTHL